MTTSRSPDSPRRGATFLIERYLRAPDLEGLSAAVARLARHCAGSGHQGGRVQYLQSVHLPTEDTCFCVVRAPSAGAVRDINRLAGFAFDRITEAVLLFPQSIQPATEDDKP